jgi:hypothetical protein
LTNDACRLVLLPGARKALRKIRKHDPDRLPFIDHALKTVVHHGWILSVHSELIKVLDPREQIGEIRDLGSGGYRLFFFWDDGESARTLFITGMEKKSKLGGKARLNEFISAAIRLRRRYLEEREEGFE